jgi:hypothetical protein
LASAPAPGSVSVAVTVNPKDIARVTKRLDKWQGAQLAKRVEKAIQGGLSLFVPRIRAGARGHHVTGKTERSVRVNKLRKRTGEIVAYKVGPNEWYSHFPISGPYSAPGDPYVEQAEQELGGEVMSFIDDQITRLA